MDQKMIRAVCCILVGPTGRRLPAYCNVKDAFTQGLFSDYFTYNSILTSKTFYKYLRATTPFPHFLWRHYGGANDYRRTLNDMMNLVDTCVSLTLLRQIQDELYQWIVSYLPAEESETVCQNYVAQNPSRSDIAVFFSDALHFAMTRDIVANRPSETKEASCYSEGKEVSQ